MQQINSSNGSIAIVDQAPDYVDTLLCCCDAVDIDFRDGFCRNFLIMLLISDGLHHHHPHLQLEKFK